MMMQNVSQVRRLLKIIILKIQDGRDIAFVRVFRVKCKNSLYGRA